MQREFPMSDDHYQRFEEDSHSNFETVEQLNEEEAA